MRTDLNADVGEGLDEVDEALLPLLTSVNVACGRHAGDEATMARVVGLAVRHDVAIGAHPGYPDRNGFGRRRVDLNPDELRATIVEQLERLEVTSRNAGVVLRHVKPHGALRFTWIDMAAARARWSVQQAEIRAASAALS